MTQNLAVKSDSLVIPNSTEIMSAHKLLLTQKSLTKIELLPTQKSSTLHSSTTDAEIRAHKLLLTQKSLTKIESLPTKKSLTQPMSYPIQKSTTVMKSFLILLFPSTKHKAYVSSPPHNLPPTKFDLIKKSISFKVLS